MKKQNENSNGLKTAFIVVAAIIVLGLIVTAFVNLADKQSELAQPTPIDTTNAQIVSVKVIGSQYVMNPPTIKQGMPTIFEFDMSTVQGCARSVVLPDFKVRKSLSAQDNKIEFLPLQTGTYRIACSMNMYTGSFNVQ